MKPVINPRIELKLGRKVLATIAEMGDTPRNNTERFAVVKRQLARAVAAYMKYTGSEKLLLAPGKYGYHVR